MPSVLITGCSSGLGRTAALYFADKGWNVIATMRQPQPDSELDNQPGIWVTRLDVQDSNSIRQAIAEGIRRFGHIDVVINNAGFGLFGVFEATSEQKIQQQFDVNLFGVMRVCREILPHFRARKSGVIVNISSGAGVFTLPMISSYSASKFALEGFSEALRYELRSLGIRVKIVEPGGVVSTRFGQRSAEEAATLATVDDYQPFIDSSMQHFARLRAERLASEQDVADVIFRASSDGSAQLRYVATEDIMPLVQARRETSEADYIALMDSQFS